MEKEIGRMVCSFESGRMTRRELVAGLMALAAAGTGASAAALAQESTFQATGLNHIALRVRPGSPFESLTVFRFSIQQ